MNYVHTKIVCTHGRRQVVLKPVAVRLLIIILIII